MQCDQPPKTTFTALRTQRRVPSFFCYGRDLVSIFLCSTQFVVTLQSRLSLSPLRVGRLSSVIGTHLSHVLAAYAFLFEHLIVILLCSVPLDNFTLDGPTDSGND